jgi:hypothetical protein
VSSDVFIVMLTLLVPTVDMLYRGVLDSPDPSHAFSRPSTRCPTTNLMRPHNDSTIHLNYERPIPACLCRLLPSRFICSQRTSSLEVLRLHLPRALSQPRQAIRSPAASTTSTSPPTQVSPFSHLLHFQVQLTICSARVVDCGSQIFEHH